MDTDIYRATRLAYRLGRQDQQRILEHRLRKRFDSDVQADQLRDLAAGMTDELVDFSAIIRAAEEGSTPLEVVNRGAPVNSDRPRSLTTLKFRHTETCPRISDPGSECLTCEVFQHLHEVRDWQAGAAGAATIMHPPRIGPHTEAAYAAHKSAYETGSEAYRIGADVVGAGHMAAKQEWMSAVLAHDPLTCPCCQGSDGSDRPPEMTRICWHCHDVLVPSEPRCERCPEECGDPDCKEPGCWRD